MEETTAPNSSFPQEFSAQWKSGAAFSLLHEVSLVTINKNLRDYAFR